MTSTHDIGGLGLGTAGFRDDHRLDDALARLSETPGALTRVYLSKEQRAADDLVLAWMREAGMSAHLDAIGRRARRSWFRSRRGEIEGIGG